MHIDVIFDSCQDVTRVFAFPRIQLHLHRLLCINSYCKVLIGTYHLTELLLNLKIGASVSILINAQKQVTTVRSFYLLFPKMSRSLLKEILVPKKHKYFVEERRTVGKDSIVLEITSRMNKRLFTNTAS
ncbi:BA75_03311T0 [Komagataella pastoris]|uniref:BA75_03311T0 n=1 Tax=Komagataella pastoris TaxID=4922 RepID=A0A1B2JB00_PICPA|nr:BA75_03311T0 [Komagataella pastoris]